MAISRAPEAKASSDNSPAVQNDSIVHAVRRLDSGAFDYVTMTTLGLWSAGQAPPAEPTLAQSGLVLVPYGDGMVLLALSADAGGSIHGISIRYTVLHQGAWSPWATLLSDSSTPRSFLSPGSPRRAGPGRR